MSLDSFTTALADDAVGAYYLLRNIAIITIVGLLIERLLPAERAQSYSRLGFNLLCVPVLVLLGGLAASGLNPLVAPFIGPNHPGWLHIGFRDGFWGSLAAIAVYILIYDFFYYWWHRAQHESAWLWSQHKLHHSDRAINTSSTLRHHWLESPFRIFLNTLPMGLLFDLKNPDVAWLAAIFGYWPFFIHMNLRLDLGPFTRVLAGPQYHRIHHSLESSHHNKNYAAYVPVWDIIFGTAYLPKRDEFPPTGLDGDEDTHLGKALIQPFLDWYRRARDRVTKRARREI